MPTVAADMSVAGGVRALNAFRGAGPVDELRLQVT